MPPRRLCSNGLAGGGTVAFSMLLGLMAGRPFRRAISARCGATVCVNAAFSAMTPSVKASSSGRLSADRPGGMLTHRFNPRLAPLLIRKIVLAADHPHSVAFPAHHGEPLALCQPALDWTKATNRVMAPATS